jgi:hypothetical protein
MPDAAPLPPADEFFIGWLPMPQSYSRLLRVLAPLTVLVAAGMAAALPLWQQSTGSGTWETKSAVTVEGFLQAEPYALLRTIGATKHEGVRTILLVEEGKFGARERALPLDGQFVRASGTFLHREGRWMLELSTGSESLQIAKPPPDLDQSEFLVSNSDSGQPVTLQGEIIDPKCYLGAMKPGGGKTHKACAILCISGGIPPMLAVRDAAGHETFYLLTDPEGASAKDCVLRYVGDFVELQGDLKMRGDLPVLRVNPASIRRL